MKTYPSYLAGFTDTLKKFKRLDLASSRETDFIYPNEDKGELDLFEYLRGKVEALELLLIDLSKKQRT